MQNLIDIPTIEDEEIEEEDHIKILQRARQEKIAEQKVEEQQSVPTLNVAPDLEPNVPLSSTSSPPPLQIRLQSTRRPQIQPHMSTSYQGALTTQPIPPAQTIYAANRQKNNPILREVKNVKIEYRGDIAPDYIMSEIICALYISIAYHLKNDEYLWKRIQTLPITAFSLRIILCHVDTSDNEKAIQEITRMCLAADCTLILCFSAAEAARYLELYKVYENKSAKMIQVKVEDDYMPRLHDCLTSVRSINKTDVVTLANNFGSLRNLMEASLEQLTILPGFGEKKVKRLYDTFHTRFIPVPKKKEVKQSSLHDFVQK